MSTHLPPTPPFPPEQPADDPFAPEVVDEQIATRLAESGATDATAASARETRLLRLLAENYTAPDAHQQALGRTYARLRAAESARSARGGGARAASGASGTARRSHRGRLSPRGMPPAPAQRDHPNETPPTSRRRALFAGIAAVALVSLLVGAFARLLTSRSPVAPVATETPFATPAPTLAPTASPSVATTWASIPGYSEGNLVPLSIAPTDIHIAYDFSYPDPQCLVCNLPAQPLVSHDEGRTWTLMQLPTALAGKYDQGTIEAYRVQISPFDAQVIFVSVFDTTDSACATYAAQGGCFRTFRSADGGQTWQELSLPVPGGFQPGPLGQADVTNLLTPIPGTGQRFYGLVDAAVPNAGGQTPPARLLLTADAGQTWQAVDGPLAARGQGIVSFGTSLNGMSIYALTEPTKQMSAGTAPADQFWVTHDGGATWTQHELPVSDPVDLGVASFPDHDAPYLLGSNGAGSPFGFYGSTDGGLTWAPAPSAGLPPGTRFNSTPFSSFTDAVLATTTIGTLVTWQPGAPRWQVVATAPPAFSNQPPSYTIVITANGAQTELVAFYQKANVVRALSYAL